MEQVRVPVGETRQNRRGPRRRAADELDVRFSLPRGMTREVAREKCLKALATIVEGEPQ
jgi:hypothetical protein